MMRSRPSPFTSINQLYGAWRLERPDGIESDNVRHLTSRALRQLVIQVNHILHSGWPHRTGEFWKLFRSQRRASHLTGCPATANLGKVMERLIANRLRWWLESGCVISRHQAGFRKGRSTIDQCIRLSQINITAVNLTGVVGEWSSRWRLDLYMDKWETYLFTSSRQERA